jgi:hypothetical protein
MAESEGQTPKKKGGRPADPRPLVGNVRVAAEDLRALEYLERRTALAADELIRMLVHLALWESGDDAVPVIIRDALNEARKIAKGA